MFQLTRRSFLEHTLAVAGAGLAIADRAIGSPADVPASQSAPRVNPNSRIGVAVIGLHGRGLSHVDAYSFDDRVQIVALCDIDHSSFAAAQKMLQSRGRPPATQYTDIRKLVEDKSVDAVSIATPNHWHALAAFWAMQAGKDAYVEKPVSHELTEGRRLEQARVKFNRICQAGTQARSNPAHMQGIEYIHKGGIGRVLLARGLCYKLRNSIGHFPDAPVPAGVDYDLWLGPAPLRPFNPNRFHYNWHWNWDYGNGDIGNQGIHQVDIARWAIGQQLPKSAISLGGRFGYEDDGQTPNTQLALFEYPDAPPVLFEVRGLKSPPLMGVGVGNIVYGTEGFVAFANEDSRSVVAFDAEGKAVKTFRGSASHFANFISAVQNRKQSDLHCPILEGHLSSAMCHLANISYRTGKPHPFAARAAMLGYPIDFAEAFGRFEQHLADSALKLQESSYQFGPRLGFDPAAEKFPANPQANALLRREYRQPFVLPEEIEAL
jgi:predicted dehydrogenase